jgi:Protein of unknown function (DUF3500)
MKRKLCVDGFDREFGCDQPKNRRSFLVTSAAATGVAATVPSMVWGEPSRTSAAETVIAELYQSLSKEQKGSVARSWDDSSRLKVNANWHITKPLIGDTFYDTKQRLMVYEIVKNLTSESGYARLKEQTDDDDGGIEAYSMAWFGEPGAPNFEWMLTGRHLTLRADGNCQDKVAFGGPVVYGHGNEDAPKDNLFYYQTEKVQRVYDALSTEQRGRALINSNPPPETKVQIQGLQGRFAGISIGELAPEQRSLFEDALKTILNMYRDDDSSEALSIIEKQGGLEKLSLAYFSKGDLKSDKVWDVWRIEGPSAVVHFRGAPHVHAYIHVKAIESRS